MQLEKVTKVLRRLAGGASLAQAVTLAATSPAAYVRRFARRLEERGVSEPDPHLPWIALVDVCIAKRIGLELDYTEDPPDALKALRRLVPAAKRSLLPTPRELEPLLPNDLQALLRYFGDRLEAAGVPHVILPVKSATTSETP
jgi:hypothetical protein